MIWTAALFIISIYVISINAQNSTAKCIGRDLKSLYMTMVVEQMEDAFYASGLAQFERTENQCDNHSQLAIVKENIEKRISALSRILTNVGGTPLPSCLYNFDIRSQQDFFRKARLIGKIKLSYLTYASAQVKDPSIRMALVSMVTEDAKKSALIDFLLDDGLSAQGLTMEVPLSENQVLTMLNGLITSCPFDMNVMGIGSYARLRSVREVAAGQVLFVDFGGASRFSEAVYCNFVFESESLLVPLSPEKNSCQVPSNARGDIYVAIVTDKGKIGECCKAGFIVAGPTIVSITAEKCTFLCPKLPEIPIQQPTVTFSVSAQTLTPVPTVKVDSLPDPNAEPAVIPSVTPPVPEPASIPSLKPPVPEAAAIPAISTPVPEPGQQIQSVMTPAIVIPYNPAQVTDVQFKFPYAPAEVTTSETPASLSVETAVIPTTPPESVATTSLTLTSSTALIPEPAIIPITTSIDTATCRPRSHSSSIAEITTAQHESSAVTTYLTPTTDVHITSSACTTSTMVETTSYTTATIEPVVETFTQVIQEVATSISEIVQYPIITYVEPPSIEYSTIVQYDIQSSVPLPEYETHIPAYPAVSVAPAVVYETTIYTSMATIKPVYEPQYPIQPPVVVYETQAPQAATGYETKVEPVPQYATTTLVQYPPYQSTMSSPSYDVPNVLPTDAPIPIVNAEIPIVSSTIAVSTTSGTFSSSSISLAQTTTTTTLTTIPVITSTAQSISTASTSSWGLVDVPLEVPTNTPTADGAIPVIPDATVPDIPTGTPDTEIIGVGSPE